MMLSGVKKKIEKVKPNFFRRGIIGSSSSTQSKSNHGKTFPQKVQDTFNKESLSY